MTVASPVSGRGPAPMGPAPGGSGFAGAPRARWLVAGPPSGGGTPSATATYEDGTAAIAEVLSGGSSLAVSFDVNAFFARAGNANCYGPSLRFENHPDARGAEMAAGQLPGGDLGIWTAQTESGEACAAAQLNARMRDVQNQVSMGLMGLAGLVAAYESTGQSWPDDVAPGDSVDLTAEMEALGLDGVTIASATMSLDADGSSWSYALGLGYDAASGDTKNIQLALQHRAVDRSTGAFEGLLSYAIEDESNGGNCRDRPSGDVTLNGSVHYIKGATSSLVLQARSAAACGLASAEPSANLLHDPVVSDVLSGDAVDPSSSWADNFNVFTAEFDPTTLLGNYSYAWQAGSGDSHTRVLAVGLETEAGGEAYFGFGDRVQASLSGEIKGFLCNWAGPGGDHAPADFGRYAQRQFLTRDAATERYVTLAPSDSNITYAPTNSCMYDGSGIFSYDRNLNDDLSDESADTTAVMRSDTTLAFDLMAVSEGESTITEHIAGRGYDLPSYP